ncbi:hypothetical protein CG471_23755 [Sphingobium sp. IP1]|nr:hypothetical protein CG471_23755 [Sphingobium sp. IP1]
MTLGKGRNEKWSVSRDRDKAIVKMIALAGLLCIGELERSQIFERHIENGGIVRPFYSHHIGWSRRDGARSTARWVSNPSLDLSVHLFEERQRTSVGRPLGFDGLGVARRIRPKPPLRIVPEDQLATAIDNARFSMPVSGHHDHGKAVAVANGIRLTDLEGNLPTVRRNT